MSWLKEEIYDKKEINFSNPKFAEKIHEGFIETIYKFKYP